MNQYLAELIGTFWLVLGGCGSAVLAAAFPQLGIGFHSVPLAFGLTVLTMAYAIGHISGCHLNPAVSFGLWAGGRFPTKDLVPYVAAQVIGSVAGQVLDGVGAGVRGGDDGDVPVRHHGLDPRQGAGRLCADRHRPGPDADSPGQLLPLDIRAIVSNHRDFYQLAASYNVPFHHIAVSKANKAQAEERQMEIIEAEGADLVVLARYMQVLSDDMCRRLAGRAINIHHSFLPSFKGAKPYYQAHDRGVKLIGATAHYVTADLDEGPIIEQDVARVDHTDAVEDLTAVGRDTESQVLARAVKWHSEHRVLLNGHRTVVFR